MSSPLTALIDLRARSGWDVDVLLAPDADQLWDRLPLLPVSALAQLLAPRSEAEDDEPVVTPGTVDARTGDVRTRRGGAAHRLVLRVGSAATVANVGDVLVPQMGNGPCVLVGKQHDALSFVNFVALRSERSTTGLWLWAALTSVRGQTLRRALSVGGTAGRLPASALLTASMPTPPPPADARYARIAELNAGIRVAETSEGRSWWRVTTLPRDGQWHRHLTTPTPEMFDRGTPLGELAGIFAGRNPTVSFEQPRPDALPVLTAALSMVSG